MTRTWAFLLCGMMPAMAGEMPGKAAGYHEALRKRPESEALFTRFRDAWLEEKPAADLENELLSRAKAGESGAWGILGRELLAAGKEDEALEAFGKAIVADAKPAWLRLARAKLLLGKKDFAAAEKDALAVPEGDRLKPDALKLAGLACLRGERVEEALAHWKKAVDAAPGDKGLLEDLTELTRREGRYDLALDFCVKWRDATEDAYGKAMATLKRSELLLASQRFEEAMKELGEVLKVSGDGSWLEREALARAEQSYQRRGDATGWVTQITTWAEANPVRLNFRRAQAQALATAGKAGEALAVLGDVLKRVPGDREARWQRIGLLERDLKVEQAFEECSALAAEEKSEESGLKVAELAFRLGKKDEIKKALDGVIAAADPAKRINLAGLYARYGLPAESEKQWRALAGGESGGQALRELAKQLRVERREKEAVEVWKEIGRRDLAQDRIDAAEALAAAGEKEAAHALLDAGRERFSSDAAYEVARAELALQQGRRSDARAIFRELAARAQRLDEIHLAVKGWLRAAGGEELKATKELGESTGDRCLRAALLAESDQPLPPMVAGDELERAFRLALLRQNSKWPEVVAMLETSGGSGPLFFSDLLEAKSAAGDKRGALSAAQAWRERAPDQPGPWMKEASLLSANGEIEAAEVLLRRAVARFDSDEEVARALFGVLDKNSDTVPALDLAWQRHDQAADAAVRASWLREILRVSKEGQRLDDLRERLEERSRRDPASPGPLVALADLARARGDLNEEMDLMAKAATCAPRDVPIISRLATLEEQMGRPDRALERYTELARLAPGVESARQLAQAKLRNGDVAGGMRDFQALAGDQGVDVRALEQSVLQMAGRGYVEEAIELLSLLDPALIDARLHFILGSLLEADGRQAEALDHFLKVMEEPPDPAEVDRKIYNFQSLLGLVRSFRQGRSANVLQFRYMQLPGSLVEAKAVLPPRIVQLASAVGGEAWVSAGTLVPALRAATVEQWREVISFADEGQNEYSAKWWDFIRRFPENPLGPEFLYETQQYATGTPEQVALLLKLQPAVSLRLATALHLSKAEPGADTVEWLVNVEPAAWRDPISADRVLAWADRFLQQLELGENPNPEAAARMKRVLSVLEKVDFRDHDRVRVHLLFARQALLEGQVEGFLSGVQRALEAVPGDLKPVIFSNSPEGLKLGSSLVRWNKVKGEAALDALIDRLPSPALRCLAEIQAGRTFERCEERGEKELASLPADAPLDQKRELIRLKWRFIDRKKDVAGLRKELETIAADDSDPLMALEAFTQLLFLRDGGPQGLTPAERQRMERLLKRVDLGDESDRQLAAKIAPIFGRQRPSVSPGGIGRWGPPASSSHGPSSSSNNGLIIRRILGLKDHEAAVREAVVLLESTARGGVEVSTQLRAAVGACRKAGVLDEALARIELPAKAGYSRTVAMFFLMDVAGKKAEARAILASLRKYHSSETHWTMELAVRSEEREETFRLLDEVAGKPDFTKELFRTFFEGSSPPNVAHFALLADWAERPQADRSWMGAATVILGGKLAANNDGANERKDLYQRYCKLALSDAGSAEMAFRSMHVNLRSKEPAAVEDGARQALLSGAYAAGFGQGTVSNVAMPQAPASLEVLVIAAREKGDEVVFSQDFRDRLKAVDPGLAGWLSTLLATKRATDLPDVSDAAAISNPQDVVRVAKHEAALLRAVNLAGRDELLEKLGRDKKLQTVSGNVVHVIRESLRDAVKDKAVEQRLRMLLEASAGPQKGWKAGDLNLTNVSGRILEAACTSDSEVLVAVLKSFTAWQVPAQTNHNPAEALSKLWRRDMGQPKLAKWEALPGTGLRDALQLGVWYSNVLHGAAGDPQGSFKWIFPQALQMAGGGPDAATFVQECARNPKATFLDLMRASAMTKDPVFEKRALKLAMPELEKLPAEIQEAVCGILTQNLEENDLEGLPQVAAVSLRKRLDSHARRD